MAEVEELSVLESRGWTANSFGGSIGPYTLPLLQDFQADLANRTIKGFDLHYQLSRLRNAKNMSEAEAELIYCSLGNAVNTYEQVIEASD